MAKRVQIRRGTTTEHSVFTGAEGECTVDTTKDTLVVHDNTLAGGYPLAREDLSNVSNSVGINQLNFSDGTAGQFLKTDGAGNFSFDTVDTSGTAVGGDVTGTVANIQIGARVIGITELFFSDGTAGQFLKTDGAGNWAFDTIDLDVAVGGDLTGTVSNAQIAANTITATELVDDAVTTSHILDSNVTADKIASDSITTIKILDSNVTTAKIADDAITEAKITAQTITNASIAPGTIRSAEIENATITGTDIADNAISGQKIALGGDTLNDLMYYDGTNWSRTAGWFYDVSFVAGYNNTFGGKALTVNKYGEMVMGRSGTFEGGVGHIDTPSTGADVIVDIEKNGSSMYSVKPKFTAGTNTMTPGTLSTTTFVSGDRVTFRVTQIGNSGTEGQGLRFMMKCKA